jgi:hypothetical protein
MTSNSGVGVLVGVGGTVAVGVALGGAGVAVSVGTTMGGSGVAKVVRTPKEQPTNADKEKKTITSAIGARRRSDNIAYLAEGQTETERTGMVRVSHVVDYSRSGCGCNRPPWGDGGLARYDGLAVRHFLLWMRLKILINNLDDSSIAY